MIKRHQTRANIGVGIGIVLAIGAAVAISGGEPAPGSDRSSPSGPILQVLGLFLALVAVIFWIWGCVNYAQGKGYGGWLGVLGLFGLIGLIVLAVLPDRRKHGQPPPVPAPNPPPSAYPPPPGSPPP